MVHLRRSHNSVDAHIGHHDVHVSDHLAVYSHSPRTAQVRISLNYLTNGSGESAWQFCEKCEAVRDLLQVFCATEVPYSLPLS